MPYTESKEGSMMAEKTCDPEKFYQLHPQYLPFVGEAYGTHRILVIGESHYIHPEECEINDLWRTPEFYDGWWDTWGSTQAQADFVMACGEHYHTRAVCKNYLDPNQGHKNYGIFRRFTQDILWPVFYGKRKDDIPGDWSEKTRPFQTCAFINFFQIPAIGQGQGIGKSLSKMTGEGQEKLAADIAANSCEIVEYVIKALQPTIVVFLSSVAANIYGERKKPEFMTPDCEKVPERAWIRSCHPSSFWWNRKMKKYCNVCDINYREATEKLFQRAVNARQK